jgi:hypothetical protein
MCSEPRRDSSSRVRYLMEMGGVCGRDWAEEKGKATKAIRTRQTAHSSSLAHNLHNLAI